jgi:hypothetical protein
MTAEKERTTAEGAEGRRVRMMDDRKQHEDGIRMKLYPELCLGLFCAFERDGMGVVLDKVQDEVGKERETSK